MNTGLTITISWEFFLSILGSLLAVTWYAATRFSRIETVIAGIDERLTTLEGTVRGIFRTTSPISLTRKGGKVLKQSGLKAYIDTNRSVFCAQFEAVENAYDLQRAAFSYFDSLEFEGQLEMQLKHVAFREGITTNVARRIGGVYLRNLLLTRQHNHPESRGKASHAMR